MVWNLFKNNQEGKQGKKEEGLFLRTLSSFSQGVSKAFRKLMGEKELSSEAFEALEELLLEADFGPALTEKMMETVQLARLEPGEDPLEKRIASLKTLLLEQCSTDSGNEAILDIFEKPSFPSEEKKSPFVVLLLGVNGSGKTTSTAKLAYRAKMQGKRVLVAAADTFRAAAVGQLKEWSETIGCEFFGDEKIKDPSALCYKALSRGKEEGMDLVLIDTAGRLQNREPLMQELEKMQRSCEKVLGRKIDAKLLVMDAVTGQNALSQSERFEQTLGIDGVVLTKVDGGAKGGALVQMMQKHKVPILYLGHGENIEAIKPFVLETFIDQLLTFSEQRQS